MANAVVTVAELGEICRRAVTTQPGQNADFRSTVNQVYFFILVRLQKQGLRFRRAEDLLEGYGVEDLTAQVNVVVDCLAEWGEMVTALKQSDDLEWELLRIQMTKALKRYTSQQQGDALQNALLKIFELLGKIPDLDWATLDPPKVVALVAKKRAHLTNIYDFRSSFYAFAKSIAHNMLRDQLRKEGRRLRYLVYVEDMATDLPDSQSFLSSSAETDGPDLSQLRADLTHLLDQIQHHLTPKPRQVVYHTLGARAQFATVLAMVDLPWPEEIPRHPNGTSDADIARVLGMTDNTVRVNRSQALKRLVAVNPILIYLLETLFKRHRS